MKNNLIKSGMALILSAFLFASCEKSNEDTLTPVPQQKMSAKEMVSNPQFLKAYKQMEDKFRSEHPDARVIFSAPFFTSDGFFLAQNLVIDWSTVPFPTLVSGQFAFFGDDLDNNDFFRLNNDGTTSVHITSSTADASHYDIQSNVELSANNANLSMNYTGPVVTFDILDPFGNVLFTINFIDIVNNPRAISFHSTGKVSAGPNMPKQNLIGKWVCNPGWTQTDIGFKLN